MWQCTIQMQEIENIWKNSGKYAWLYLFLLKYIKAMMTFLVFKSRGKQCAFIISAVLTAQNGCRTDQLVNSLRSGLSEKVEPARNPLLCRIYSFSQRTRNLIGSK
jgi:hypothetical protein